MTATTPFTLELNRLELAAAIAETEPPQHDIIVPGGSGDTELSLDDLDTVRADLNEILQNTETSALVTVRSAGEISPITLYQLSFDASYGDEGFDGIEVNAWFVLPVSTGDDRPAREHLALKPAWINRVRHDELDHTSATASAVSLLHIGLAEIATLLNNAATFFGHLHELTVKPAPATATPQLDGVLDPASVRAEIEEAPGAHDLETNEAAAILTLDDNTITMAINEAIARDGDNFWEAYDNLRRDVIGLLRQQIESSKGAEQ